MKAKNHPTSSLSLKERPRQKTVKKNPPPPLSKFPLAPHESYFGKYNVKSLPNSKELITQLANEMVEWAITNGDAYAIEDFPLSKCIAPSEYYKCAERDEYFAKALEIARYVIGSRLQAAARDGEIDSKFVLRILPMYNSEYKELMMSKLKQFQKSMESPPVNVILRQFPSSDLVPERQS